MAPYRAECDGVVADVLSGARRGHACSHRRKAAADGAVLATVLAALTGEDLRAKRDRAGLVFGMAYCLGRSELVALEVSDFQRMARSAGDGAPLQDRPGGPRSGDGGASSRSL